MPDYVPHPIVEDYNEACLIQSLSPKASATLSRRCLQGIIRDFFGISKGTLAEEIKAIEDKVDAETWKSIDAVRSIGNIGAHMEKDINVIVEVDADEAAHLVWLIELLVEDWYVARHERQLKHQSIRAIRDKMNAAKKAKPSNVDSESAGNASQDDIAGIASLAAQKGIRFVEDDKF
ncbi:MULTISPECIES: DUF4145 domain-containing protein [Cupriavidus]|nr:DUF4145 domain-containing protein [Cupriavidus pauculus]